MASLMHVRAVATEDLASEDEAASATAATVAPASAVDEGADAVA